MKMLWLYLPLHFLSKGVVRAFSSVSRATVLLEEQCTIAQSCPIPPLAPFSYHAYRPTDDVVVAHEIFDLQRVVVIHRHGDRSQINAELGVHFPAGREIDEFWQQRLPNAEWIRALANQSVIELHSSIFPDKDQGRFTQPNIVRHESDAYVGADKDKAPYGMLTKRGVEQLARVGNKLRQRYGTFLSGGKSENIHGANISMNISSIFARSTNYCRTHMSLRSLLLGLLRHVEFDPSDGSLIMPMTKMDHLKKETTNSKVTIISRSRDLETMFPRSCPILTHHTRHLYQHDNLKSSISDYDEFKTIVESVFGIRESGYWFYKYIATDSIASKPRKMNDLTLTDVGSKRWEWADIKEVLTCHLEHNSMMCPSELNLEATVTKSTEIASKIWHDKYSVDIINKYALGRFLHELIEDMSAGLQQNQPTHVNKNLDTAESLNGPNAIRSDSVAANGAADKKFLIYSGHDSTIVPLVNALGIHSVFWPPYAAHVIIEIAKKRYEGTSKTDSNAINVDETIKDISQNNMLYARVWFNDDILDINSESLLMSMSESNERAASVEVDQVSVPINTTAKVSSTSAPKTRNDTNNKGWVPFSALIAKLEKSAISFAQYKADCPEEKD